MSKSKNKTHSETEHLRGLVKSLKSENRQLRKRVKQLEKQSHFYEDIVDEVVEDISVSNVCAACEKGILQVIDLKYVVITSCDSCDFKKTRKLNGKKTQEKSS